MCYNNIDDFKLERRFEWMSTVKRINIAVDEDLHKKLRIASAVNCVTIKEYVASAILYKLSTENYQINTDKKKERKQ